MFNKKSVRENGSTRIQTVFEKASRVDVAYKTETNINTIVERFTRTGQIPQGLQRAGSFMDTTVKGTYADFALFQKNTAELFEKLPKKLRDEFGNDPKIFLANLSRKDKEEVKPSSNVSVDSTASSAQTPQATVPKA